MLAGFAVLIIVIGVLTVLLAHPDTWLENIVLGLLIIIAYVTFLLVSFLLSTIIYQYNGPRLNKDFIIVLGCGLKGKKVPQLLANRLDKAIQFHRKQQKKRGRTATFIVSGGKGPNEEIAEARAMQAYLIDKGIPKEQIFMEADSTNTEENMQFSKKLMTSIQKNFKSVFVTNNFHLFRASIYARKAGLDAQGIGGKTALYYLPTALLREFIAVLFLYRKAHITVLILLLAAFSIYVIAGHL
ncbi:YdcF family protein [Listeria grayi]|nr:YdcF family protein [Listeria grayi]